MMICQSNSHDQTNNHSHRLPQMMEDDGESSMPMSIAMEMSSNSSNSSRRISVSSTDSSDPSFLSKQGPSNSTSSSTRRQQNAIGPRYEQTLRVPTPQLPDVAAAVAFANQEFDRAAAQRLANVTITILIDSAEQSAYELDEPLVVRAAGENYQLIMDALPQSSPNQAQQPVQLSMDACRPNLPLLRLVSGHLVLRNMQIEHFSPVDILLLANTKSSNAALEIEEPLANWQAQSLSLRLEHVMITSYSGRGIMNRSLSPVDMEDCYISKIW